MNLSLEELKQRNASSNSTMIQPTQPLQTPQPCPLTQEKLDNLFYNQGLIWDGITQLQEQVKSLDEKVATLDRKIEAQRGENRRLVDYALTLRRHIEERNDPPPPAWPEGLS